MVTYMPYFISTVVLPVSMILQFTDVSTGIVNQLHRRAGRRSPTNFMGNVQLLPRPVRLDRRMADRWAIPPSSTSPR